MTYTSKFPSEMIRSELEEIVGSHDISVSQSDKLMSIRKIILPVAEGTSYGGGGATPIAVPPFPLDIYLSDRFLAELVVDAADVAGPGPAAADCGSI